jgi:hypothetical protein
MDINEAKGMLGTEFIYVFPDGDEIPAYVRAFDPEIGLTCWSLDSVTKMGWENWDENPSRVDPDGTYCLLALNIRDYSWLADHSLDKALKHLKEIKETGRYVCVNDDSGGTPNCSF